MAAPAVFTTKLLPTGGGPDVSTRAPGSPGSFATAPEGEASPLALEAAEVDRFEASFTDAPGHSRPSSPALTPPLQGLERPRSPAATPGSAAHASATATPHVQNAPGAAPQGSGTVRANLVPAATYAPAGTLQAASSGAAATPSASEPSSLRRAARTLWTALCRPFAALRALWLFTAAWWTGTVGQRLDAPAYRLNYADSGYGSTVHSCQTTPVPEHGRIRLCDALSSQNDTPEEKALNRARYLEAMARLGTWASSQEANALGKLYGLKVQIWTPAGKHDGRLQYLAQAPLGELDAGQTVHLLYVNGNHYRALLPQEPLFLRRVKVGDRKDFAEFDCIDVFAEGDCQFLAFAYTADLPYVRRLMTTLGNERAERELRALRREQPSLAEELGPTPNGQRYATSVDWAHACLDAGVRKLRREVVEFLGRPEHKEALDAYVEDELLDD